MISFIPIILLFANRLIARHSAKNQYFAGISINRGKAILSMVMDTINAKTSGLRTDVLLK